MGASAGRPGLVISGGELTRWTDPTRIKKVVEELGGSRNGGTPSHHPF